MGLDPYYYQHNAFAKMIKKDQLEEAKDFLVSASKKAETVLLSSESLSGWKKVPNSLEFAKEIFNNIKVIIYIRRQDLWLESLYQQFIKTGQLSSEDTFGIWIEKFMSSNKRSYACDWLKQLNYWSNVFGKENIQVRVYEKSQFNNENIIEDFLLQLDVSDHMQDFIFEKQFQNRRFNKHATDFLRLFNDAEDFDKWIHLLNVWIKNPYEDTGEVYFTYEKRWEILNKYKGSNEEIAKTYLHNPQGILFNEALPEKNNYPPVFLGLDDKMLLTGRKSLQNYLDFAVYKS